MISFGQCRPAYLLNVRRARPGVVTVLQAAPRQNIDFLFIIHLLYQKFNNYNLPVNGDGTHKCSRPLVRIFRQGFRADCHFLKFIVRFFKEGVAPVYCATKRSPDCCGIARLPKQGWCGIDGRDRSSANGGDVREDAAVHSCIRTRIGLTKE